MQQQFALRPSLYLSAMLMAAHAAAVAALISADLPLWAIISSALLVLCSLAYQLWHNAWLAAPSSAVALKLDKNQVTLTTRSGQRLDARILQDSLVTPYLTVLNVMPQGARTAYSALILPDSMEKESFRQLRVLLKWRNA